MTKYLDQNGLNEFWQLLDSQNTETVTRIKKLEKSCPIYYNTEDGWKSDLSLKSETGTIYIYVDRKIGEKTVPGIKIGNGAPLADLSFVDIDYIEHIYNIDIHITEDERVKWNNKVDVDVNQINEELIFVKD